MYNTNLKYATSAALKYSFKEHVLRDIAPYLLEPVPLGFNLRVEEGGTLGVKDTIDRMTAEGIANTVQIIANMSNSSAYIDSVTERMTTYLNSVGLNNLIPSGAVKTATNDAFSKLKTIIEEAYSQQVGGKGGKKIKYKALYTTTLLTANVARLETYIRMFAIDSNWLYGGIFKHSDMFRIYKDRTALTMMMMSMRSLSTPADVLEHIVRFTDTVPLVQSIISTRRLSKNLKNIGAVTFAKYYEMLGLNTGTSQIFSDSEVSGLITLNDTIKEKDLDELSPLFSPASLTLSVNSMREDSSDSGSPVVLMRLLELCTLHDFELMADAVTLEDCIVDPKLFPSTSGQAVNIIGVKQFDWTKIASRPDFTDRKSVV